ncbi:MAG: hypothetical protein C0605_10365 [Hyphomicrobiales bacterium]|nr:MAG: hypothetical protein C0605_10365 [Hyphomicrobiales bacterium]
MADKEAVAKSVKATDAEDSVHTKELQIIREEVDAGKEPTASVRELLRWFGAHRRRSGVVERVEAELETTGLRTDPDFTTAWIDAPVTFRKLASPEKSEMAPSKTPEDIEAAAEPVDDEELPEVSYLVRMLDAANREVVSVNPEDVIATAITLMMAHDFSQLAVMTGPRDLKGTISWKSIGSRLSQRNDLKTVADAMDKASEVLDTDSLFEATRAIIGREYVFVRSSVDKKITGIVTATDVSEQFQLLSEPFLLLGRIENQIRRIIQNTFDVETLRAACNDADPDRKAAVSKVSDLTFGEYQRILENEDNWKKLNFVACRKTFCNELDKVRQLRNEIMHFHPDTVEEGDFEQLRRFSRLLSQLERLSRQSETKNIAS